MIELFRDHEMARVGQYQSILEAEGIQTFIRNEALSATEAMIPVFYPALCVVDDKDHARAVEIIRSYERDLPGSEKEIACPECGELSPGTFSVCWNCGVPLGAGELPES
jgi:hypothetical protein